MINSEQSKQSTRGGRRQGAGRKSKVVEQEWTDFAQRVLTKGMAEEKLLTVLNSGDVRATLDAIKYLLDRVLGKPAQSMQVLGDKDEPLEVVIRVVGG